jgi:type III pantothenate kinase
VLRVVADLGNSRLKWARLDDTGHLVGKVALPLDPAAWAAAWAQSPTLSAQPSSWAVSTVNPPVAVQLAAFLQAEQVCNVTWFDTASQVPVPYDVEGADTGGADRALAVAAALELIPPGRPGLVVSCGTAITVERITADGIWQGGAIAPGLGTVARALHLQTAQLPLIDLYQVDPRDPPAAWGRATVSSLEAGVFWGTVGAVRELVARQSIDLIDEPWVIWTGGDAPLLAKFAARPAAVIEPNLVLIGLARVAFARECKEATKQNG